MLYYNHVLYKKILLGGIFRAVYFWTPVKAWSQETGMCFCALRIEVFLTREKIYTLLQDINSYANNALMCPIF